MTAIGALTPYSLGTRYNTQDQRASNAPYEPSLRDGRARQGTPVSGAESFDSRPVMLSSRVADQLANLTPVDISALKFTHISELPEDEYQKATKALAGLIEGHESLLLHEYSDHSPPPSSFIGGRTYTYARVMIGGSVVATIDNQGAVTSDNPFGEKLRDLLPGSLNGKNGPELAQARAELVAKLAGGRVETAPTAMTQAAFDALPLLFDWRPAVDQAAMDRDPRSDEIRTWESDLADIEKRRAAYIAVHPEAGAGNELPSSTTNLQASSSIGSRIDDGSSAYGAHADAGSSSSVEDIFLEWSRKSPAERIRAVVLEGLGLTEDQLAGLPEAEREAVERQIEDAIKRSYGLDDTEQASAPPAS